MFYASHVLDFVVLVKSRKVLQAVNMARMEVMRKAQKIEETHWKAVLCPVMLYNCKILHLC